MADDRQFRAAAEDYLAIQIGKLESRFDDLSADVKTINGRLDEGDKGRHALDRGQIEILKRLDENTELTKGLRDLFVFGRIGRSVVAWCVGIGTAVVGAYAALKGLK